MVAQTETFIALDYGARRIGVATCDSETKFPHPQRAINVDDRVFEQIKGLVESTKATKIVVGLPRNLDGEDTKQTLVVKSFIGRLRNKIDVPVYFIDEAVTSVQAEAELKSRGRSYDKGDIDSLAAVYILEDFLHAYKTVS